LGWIFLWSNESLSFSSMIFFLFGSFLSF
jgi:hypothetical protein